MAGLLGYLKSAVEQVGAVVKDGVNKAAASHTRETIDVNGRQVIIKEQLGEGGFAYVYSVEDASTGQPFAMKRMLCQDGESRTIAEREIKYLRMLKGHPHIVQYVDSCCKENRQSSHRAMEYFILMEQCTNGSLIDLIKRRDGQKLAEIEICNLFRQICSAVAHMHSFNPPIAHRDLKIENVLITSHGELRLADFGSCCTVAKAYVTQKEIVEQEEVISKYSTQMYRAPEMADLYKKVLVNEKVDVWAMGCILFTLAFFTQPFQDGGNLQIISGQYQVPESHPFSKYLTALIKRLLTTDPITRPDMKQVQNLCDQWHTFLKSGGKVVKPRAGATVDPATTASAPRTPAPATAVTDPSQKARRHASEDVDGEPKSAKVKKSKRPPTHTLAAPTESDDWADFSAAPKSAGPAASSSDSEEERVPKPSAKIRQMSQPIASSAAPSTASLFDLSGFGEALAPAKPAARATQPTSSSSTAAASTSNWQASFDAPGSSDAGLDDWASFDSAPIATRPAAPSSAVAPPRQSSADVGLEFDFSGLSATPPPVAAKSPMPKSPSSASGKRRDHHHQGRSAGDTIDLNKLQVSSKKTKQQPGGGEESSSDDEGPKPQRIGAIKLGKSKP